MSSLPIGRRHREERPLQERVQQIIDQRGAFRNITRASLRKEVEASRTGTAAQQVSSGDHDDGDQEPESRLAREQELWKRKNEMLSELSRAQNEVLTAVDFISLLLSAHSAGARSSISPALQQQVPTGSLDARIVQDAPTTTTATNRQKAASEGWRSEAFEAASQKLSEASTRLAANADSEAKYWEQVAKLKGRGWTVSRLANNRGAIGVNFGFGESAPYFRNRGLSLLRQGVDGDLELDDNLTRRRKRHAVVTVHRRGRETGRSVLSQNRDHSVKNIEAQLVDARDCLFEEELFQELGREARIAPHLGIVTHPSRVEADVLDDLVIRVEMRDRGVLEPLSGVDDELARLVAFRLRMNLIAAHENNLARRSRPPGVMGAPSDRPEYALLRPLLAQLRQNKSMISNVT